MLKKYILNKMVSAVCHMLQRKEIQHNITSLFYRILEDSNTHQAIAQVMGKECIQNQCWKNANIRPEGDECSYASIPNSLIEESFKIATKQSAEYIDKNMMHLYGIPNPLDLLTFCINEVKIDGLYLEFGVFSGYTINHIASKIKNIVHGFDSFQGIPEHWNSVPAGTFSTNGQLPIVEKNVQLHIGLFEDTLLKFKKDFCDNVAFLHIDSDLYSSAHTVLFSLKDQITKGTIIVFDEYFNYPGWQRHEYLAFQEFINQTGLKYEYLAFAGKGFSVGVRIL
jgi:hypothetical protein